MAHFFAFLIVLVIAFLMILLAIWSFHKFFKRDEGKEQAIENMIADRRSLLKKISEMQNLANSMQADIDKEISRLPVQSKKAFAEKQMLVLRDW